MSLDTVHQRTRRYVDGFKGVWVDGSELRTPWFGSGLRPGWNEDWRTGDVADGRYRTGYHVAATEAGARACCGALCDAVVPVKVELVVCTGSLRRRGRLHQACVARRIYIHPHDYRRAVVDRKLRDVSGVA